MVDAVQPRYETYQDVKSTLSLWVTPVWAGMLLCLYYLILAEPHRQAVVKSLPEAEEWIGSTGVFGALVIVGGILSYVLVHLIELHDHVYDKYVIGWRDSYAKEKMIPALLAPYRAGCPDGFMEYAIGNPGKTLDRLFYRFASDRDTKIGKNLLVRFYERVTKYWLTQHLEIAVILLVVTSVLYQMAWSGGSVRWFTVVLVGSLLVFVTNRCIASSLRKDLWEVPQEEIEAIHALDATGFEHQMSPRLLKPPMASKPRRPQCSR